MPAGLTTDHPVVRIENREAPGPFLIVCEHASNHFPPVPGTLGLTREAQTAHIAWDPGALGVARGIAKRLGAPLVAAGVSRLVYDLNRPPNAAGAMAAESETYSIPGNRGLSPAEKQRRTEEVYLAFHDALRGEVARRLARGQRPVLVTVHSFTPIWFGQPRAVELGLIHDADPAFCQLVAAEARARTGFDCRLNDPYSAADGVTHTLRLHATPYGLPHVMIEVRNDLIADAEAEDAMAGGLAAVLAGALSRFETDSAGRAGV